MSATVKTETVRGACTLILPDGSRHWTERRVTTVDDWREITVEGQDEPWLVNFGKVTLGPEVLRSQP